MHRKKQYIQNSVLSGFRASTGDLGTYEDFQLNVVFPKYCTSVIPAEAQKYARQCPLQSRESLSSVGWAVPPRSLTQPRALSRVGS